MSERDRLVLIAAVVLAVLVGTWMLKVSPERAKAAAAGQQVTTAQQTLAKAQSELQSAQASEHQYAGAEAALLDVAKAVPANSDVPSLIYELNQASSVRDVLFESITGSSGSALAASSTPTALPFTFDFTGTFFDLYHLLAKLNAFAIQNKNGTLDVTGRLLTIQAVSLTGGGSTSGSSGTSTLHGTVTADAYVLGAPAPTSSTAAGSTSTPASTSPTSAATPAVIQPGS